eukprot:scaffold2130_cov402-Prasinococcus_capsulatus_cf.AAC.5
MQLISAAGPGEPLAILQHGYDDAYIVFQLIVAVAYVTHLLIHMGMLCTVQLLMVAFLRVLTIVGIGIHYYVMIWQPAMLDLPPKLTRPQVRVA